MRLFGAKSGLKFVLMALILTGTASLVYGDSIVVTYAPAQTQAPNTATLCGSAPVCWIGEQTFNGGTVPAGNFPTLISTGGAGGAIAGSYSGAITISQADEWGGAGGTGDYPTVNNSSYTLTLSTYDLIEQVQGIITVGDFYAMAASSQIIFT